MNITETQLAAQLDAFGEHRIEIVTELAHQGSPDAIGPALLLALGSRESFLRNIVGDAGHGRGWLQIDDRFHRPFLSTHRGCDNGSWDPTHPTALPRGRVPSLTAATLYAIELLHDNMKVARNNGVPAGQVLRFAVAAYNAGAGGALQGFRAGDVDRETTGEDFSRDVLSRKAAVGRYLQRHALVA